MDVVFGPRPDKCYSKLAKKKKATFVTRSSSPPARHLIRKRYRAEWGNTIRAAALVGHALFWSPPSVGHPPRDRGDSVAVCD